MGRPATRPRSISPRRAWVQTVQVRGIRPTECSHILAARLHEAQVEVRAQLKARASERSGQRPQRQLDPRRVAALSAEYESLYGEEG